MALSFNDGNAAYGGGHTFATPSQLHGHRAEGPCYICLRKMGQANRHGVPVCVERLELLRPPERAVVDRD